MAVAAVPASHTWITPILFCHHPIFVHMARPSPEKFIDFDILVFQFFWAGPTPQEFYLIAFNGIDVVLPAVIFTLRSDDILRLSSRIVDGEPYMLVRH